MPLQHLLCLTSALLATSLVQAELNWNQLVQELQHEQTLLKQLIQQADQEGLTTDYAKGSVQVIELFKQAAQHDKANHDRVRDIFSTLWYYDKIDPIYTDLLPELELRDCIQVAQHAQAELNQQLSGQIVYQGSPAPKHGKVELSGDHFTLDGRPYFPSSLVWTPIEDKALDCFGRIAGTYFQFHHLTPEGTATRHLEDQLKRVERQQAHQMAPFVLFTGHRLPDWLQERHPETAHGGRHFVQYDIDSPIIRKTIQQLYKAYIPPLSTANSEIPTLHLLANEPHFATAEKGWANNGLSDHTVRKFHAWLSTKYQRIEQLNQAHRANYEAFDQVLFTLKTPVAERKIDPALRGSAIWYDWMRFNHDRVNDWFRFLKEESQKNDPQKSPVTIKVLGYSLSNSTRDGGMDMEYLTKLQDIMGADLRCMPLGANIYGKLEEGQYPETAWQSHFSYEWSEQSMFLDFSKSLCPEKLFYDSEWHGFGTVSWRHFNLDRDYIRSALWLAFSHGMGMINPWLWGRNEDGSLKAQADHIGELATQPIAVDAYVRTMKELNVFAPQLQAFSRPKRTFMIYYCEESAIQDETYTAGMQALYEAFKLLNWPVGFTTPTEIDTLDTETQVVVLPPLRSSKIIASNSLKTSQRIKGVSSSVMMAPVSAKMNSVPHARSTSASSIGRFSTAPSSSSWVA